jgi:hypothetical protein
VIERAERNLSNKKLVPRRSVFWKTMVGCLLTTQQKSGPQSAISRFLRAKPFSLEYAKCDGTQDIETYAEDALRRFGGIRRSSLIAREIVHNYRYLNAGGGWEHVFGILTRLDGNTTPREEREAANAIDDALKGFGPKQSRNLLQWLGYTRYEIPVDSRITKWLNEFGFPVKLTAAALQDVNYYCFILDGIQQLCASGDVYPCVFDAAVFASYNR